MKVEKARVEEVRLSIPEGFSSAEKALEHYGRVCYRSEDKITQDSADRFVKMLYDRGHHAMLEFVDATVIYSCDRGMSHEQVRHRLVSYAQECVSGDTEIKKGLTVKQLYDRHATPMGREYNRRLHLKSMAEDGRIVPNSLVDVWSKGVAKVYAVTTQLGYSLKTTSSHRFCLPEGVETELGDLSVGDQVLVNCHNKLHHGWYFGTKVHQDEIVSIELVGEEEVFELEMMAPLRNFVGNGIVTHNSTRYCNYSRDKFDSQITVIEQPTLEKNYAAKEVWMQANRQIEEAYLKLLDLGIPPQSARSILPIGLKTRLVVKANLREWLTIFGLRCDTPAHEIIRACSKEVLFTLFQRVPSIFTESAEKYLAVK